MHLKTFCRFEQYTCNIQTYELNIKRASAQKSVVLYCLSCEMYKLLLITFFLYVSFTNSETHEKYCENSLCPPGVKHIACRNSGNFDPSCPIDKKIVHLSAANIEAIVDSHNFYRNKIAMGDEDGFPSASRMATMVRIRY